MRTTWGSRPSPCTTTRLVRSRARPAGGEGRGLPLCGLPQLASWGLTQRRSSEESFQACGHFTSVSTHTDTRTDTRTCAHCPQVASKPPRLRPGRVLPAVPRTPLSCLAWFPAFPCHFRLVPSGPEQLAASAHPGPWFLRSGVTCRSWSGGPQPPAAPEARDPRPSLSHPTPWHSPPSPGPSCQ